ncbi:flagellar hook-associated protein 2 [Paenibacillus taihuensis]|uniref:Flagellar hook-associated protein 2 n=1 Tax=Paenibacillus taihuensis TaxID=1156355 RepID=A0A3D9RWZ0_9BACL|nr:flagellar filament capping protein FliD [Paenibacillus taihuensis]REE84490.1 flagellar hook-associated protein 2 [Paenibacillus taihuensis]
MVMRIAGLGSGMDIDSMVTKLMTAERAPLDKLKQTDQKLAWKAQAYRDINVKLAAFRDSLSSLRFSGSWGKTSSTSSDTSKIDVSSVGTASAGTHNIVVTSLARGANAVSSSAVTASAKLEGTANLSAGLTIASDKNQLNVTLNGVTKTVTVAAGVYADGATLQTAIQSAMDKSFGANQIKADTTSGTLKLTPQGDPAYLPQLKVEAGGGDATMLTSLGLNEGQSFKLDSSTTLSSQSAKLAGGVNLTGDTFTINGQSFTISSTDTLNSVMARVNSSSAGVNMYYDSVTDKISVASKTTGDTAKIVFGASSNFQTAFNLSTPAAAQQGKNAVVKIDGVDGTYATNTVTSNGVTYTLKGQTDAAGINVNVNQDTDSIYNSITDFVNKYNDLLTSLNTKINEPVYRDFQPLTDDQKKAMNETDITNWEAKAKSGLLARDSNLQQLRDSMRQISYSSVSTLPSDMNALYEIGITTSGYTKGDTTNAGKLSIDATKLKDAISRDPQGVIKIFANQSLTDTTEEQGVMQRLYSSSSSTITNIIKTAGSGSEAYDKVTNTLGNQVNKLNVKILDMQDKLTTKENNYYSMFSKMDTAIANSNAQVGWLSSFMN